MGQRQITFLEGWTYAQFRQALRANPDVKQTLGDIGDAALMARLGSPIKKPEGLFFPDTYVFTPGTSDFDLLRRAYQQTQPVLAEAWAERQPDVPLDPPSEALILAPTIQHKKERR